MFKGRVKTVLGVAILETSFLVVICSIILILILILSHLRTIKLIEQKYQDLENFIDEKYENLLDLPIQDMINSQQEPPNPFQMMLMQWIQMKMQENQPRNVLGQFEKDENV